MAKPQPAEISEAARSRLLEILSDLTYELIPLKNVIDQAGYLPEGATVSVTASPAKGMDATIDLAVELKQMGLKPVPHLSARLTHDVAHLERMLKRNDAADIHHVFVVGGDADPPGEFFDALTFIETMENIGHSITTRGITAYPEGHPVIPNDKLEAALRDKQPFADYMTTQMCFRPDTIAMWLSYARADGIDLPVKFGIPGVAELLKLMRISARIGVGDSLRFMSKNTSLVGKLVRPGGYSPDGS